MATEGVFVTGTGTEVGKTVVAAAIARTFASEGKRVHVFKPAVTGLDEGVETDHALLRRASGSTQSDDEIAPYRYGPAASPHLAAALAGEKIDPEHLRQTASTAAEDVDVLVCEGVGGLLVPLTPNYLVRDLAVDLGYPLVIVAPPGLGTINHTLLTVEAARAANLYVAAIILNSWPIEPTQVEVDNRKTIFALADALVQTFPQLDAADPNCWPSLSTPVGSTTWLAGNKSRAAGPDTNSCLAHGTDEVAVDDGHERD
jgi:dethiobiotin synthetase